MEVVWSSGRRRGIIEKAQQIYFNVPERSGPRTATCKHRSSSLLTRGSAIIGVFAEGDNEPTGSISSSNSAAECNLENASSGDNVSLNEDKNSKTSKNEMTESGNEDDSCISEDYDEFGGSGLESDLEDNLEVEEGKLSHVPRWLMRDPMPQELPETVTLLHTEDGGKVFLVGTAHFSKESQDDVAKIIQAAKPDIVLVELCKSRVSILSLDEKTIMEESQNLNMEKMRSVIKQHGFIQGIMYLLLLSMSAHLTKQLGMAPGGEFRTAFSEAKRVPGCLIHLGDRPIQITLRRALGSLSWWQKMRLAWHILLNKEPISKEEVERCKKRDLLEEMMAEMTGEFPALSTVFVKERDTYLTYSLQLAAAPVPCCTSPTGSLPAVVVGVVGIGHVPGIIENWGKVTEKDIPPILRIPKPSMTSRLMKRAFQGSLIGIAAWSCYRFLLPSAVADVFSVRRQIDWIRGLMPK